MKDYQFTGRKFKCIGLNEVFCRFWSKYFTYKKIYKEVVPPNKDYEMMQTENNILLVDDDNHLLIVDASQFKLTT